MPNVMVVSGEGVGRREREFYYGQIWYISYEGSTNLKEKIYVLAVLQWYPSLNPLVCGTSNQA